MIRLRGTHYSVILWTLMFVFLSSHISSICYAQEINANFLEKRDADAIVYITTDYYNPQITINPQSGAVGTGLIVASDGTVLTLRHVISDWLHQPNDQKKNYPLKARIKSANAPTSFPLAVMYEGDENKGDDIVVLRFLSPGPYKTIPYCFKSSLEDGARLHVLGIPDTGNIFPVDGYYANSIEENGYWVTNLQILPGMSGGPVYDASGHVVGLAQGGKGLNGVPSYVFPIAMSNYLVATQGGTRKQCPNISDLQNVSWKPAVTLSEALPDGFCDCVHVSFPAMPYLQSFPPGSTLQVTNSCPRTIHAVVQSEHPLTTSNGIPIIELMLTVATNRRFIDEDIEPGSSIKAALDPSFSASGFVHSWFLHCPAEYFRPRATVLPFPGSRP